MSRFFCCNKGGVWIRIIMDDDGRYRTWRSMLTKKQKKFAREYVKNGHNGADAYKAVSDKQITDGSARTGASRMLQNDDVLSTINKLEQKAIAKAAADDVNNAARADDAAADMRAKLIAFYTDVMNGKVYNENQGIDKDSGEWMVTSRSVKASDRIAAAEKLSKLYGIEEQPAEEIQIELVCGAEELAN